MYGGFVVRSLYVAMSSGTSIDVDLDVHHVWRYLKMGRLEVDTEKSCKTLSHWWRELSHIGHTYCNGEPSIGTVKNGGFASISVHQNGGFSGSAWWWWIFKEQKLIKNYHHQPRIFVLVTCLPSSTLEIQCCCLPTHFASKFTYNQALMPLGVPSVILGITGPVTYIIHYANMYGAQYVYKM